MALSPDGSKILLGADVGGIYISDGLFGSVLGRFRGFFAGLNDASGFSTQLNRGNALAWPDDDELIAIVGANNSGGIFTRDVSSSSVGGQWVLRSSTYWIDAEGPQQASAASRETGRLIEFAPGTGLRWAAVHLARGAAADYGLISSTDHGHTWSELLGSTTVAGWSATQRVVALRYLPGNDVLLLASSGEQSVSTAAHQNTPQFQSGFAAGIWLIKNASTATPGNLASRLVRLDAAGGGHPGPEPWYAMTAVERGAAIEVYSALSPDTSRSSSLMWRSTFTYGAAFAPASQSWVDVSPASALATITGKWCALEAFVSGAATHLVASAWAGQNAQPASGSFYAMAPSGSRVAKGIVNTQMRLLAANTAGAGAAWESLDDARTMGWAASPAPGGAAGTAGSAAAGTALRNYGTGDDWFASISGTDSLESSRPGTSSWTTGTLRIAADGSRLFLTGRAGAYVCEAPFGPLAQVKWYALNSGLGNTSNHRLTQYRGTTPAHLGKWAFTDTDRTGFVGQFRGTQATRNALCIGRPASGVTGVGLGVSLNSSTMRLVVGAESTASHGGDFSDDAWAGPTTGSFSNFPAVPGATGAVSQLLAFNDASNTPHVFAVAGDRLVHGVGNTFSSWTVVKTLAHAYGTDDHVVLRYVKAGAAEHVFLALPDDGVYRATAPSLNTFTAWWSRSVSGFDRQAFPYLAFSPSGAGRLFASFGPDGVWQVDPSAPAATGSAAPAGAVKLGYAPFTGAGANDRFAITTEEQTGDLVAVRMKWTQADAPARVFRVAQPANPSAAVVTDLTDAAFGDLGVMVMDLEASDPFIGVLFNHAGLNGLWPGSGYPGDTHGF